MIKFIYFLGLSLKYSSALYVKTCRAFPLSCVATRVILFPTNKQINKINYMVLLRFNAPTQVYPELYFKHHIFNNIIYQAIFSAFERFKKTKECNDN